ncbi:MAG TPA: hypothetical protein VGB13_01910 [Candidatus Krumholzibacteria bacterium]
MAWIKLDDGFAEHPKVIGLSDRAFRLHVAALCYVARNETDGHLPLSVPRVLGVRTNPRLLGELLAAGLWKDNGVGGWVINDYLDYNPSREEAALRRERARAAGQRGGLAKAKRHA